MDEKTSTGIDNRVKIGFHYWELRVLVSMEERCWHGEKLHDSFPSLGTQLINLCNC